MESRIIGWFSCENAIFIAHTFSTELGVKEVAIIGAGGMLFVAPPFGMVLWKTMFNQKRHPELVSGSGEPYKLNTQTQTHTEPITGQARHDVAGGMLFVTSPFWMVLWKT